MTPLGLRLAAVLSATAALATPWSVFGREAAAKPPAPAYAPPAETSRLVEAPGVDKAQTYCLACHSADYVNTQPPHMPAGFWEAEIGKMRTAYGAPIPDDAAKAVAAYLNAAYPPRAP